MGSKRKKNSKKIAIIHFIPDQKLLVQRQNLSEHPFGTVKRNLNSYVIVRLFVVNYYIIPVI